MTDPVIQRLNVEITDPEISKFLNSLAHGQRKILINALLAMVVDGIKVGGFDVLALIVAKHMSIGDLYGLSISDK